MKTPHDTEATRDNSMRRLLAGHPWHASVRRNGHDGDAGRSAASLAETAAHQDPHVEGGASEGTVELGVEGGTQQPMSLAGGDSLEVAPTEPEAPSADEKGSTGRAVRPATTYRLFGIYSGRYEPDGKAPIYEDTRGATSKPMVEHAPEVFLDLVSAGAWTGSNISLYLRIYGDGRATYLGPHDRRRALPQQAVRRWNDAARRYGLPVASPLGRLAKPEAEA